MTPLPAHINGESIASFLSRVPRQKVLEKLLEALTSTPPPKCYYCNLDKFKSKARYERHVILHHSGKLCYPNLAYIKSMNLKAQGCVWEGEE